MNTPFPVPQLLVKTQQDPNLNNLGEGFDFLGCAYRNNTLKPWHIRLPSYTVRYMWVFVASVYSACAGKEFPKFEVLRMEKEKIKIPKNLSFFVNRVIKFENMFQCKMSMLCTKLLQNCVSSAKWEKLLCEQPGMLYNVKYI